MSTSSPSSCICFGCAVDNLEDSRTTSQRKKILAALLEIFVSCNDVGTLFSIDFDVSLRLLNTSLSIIHDNCDYNLSALACECCIIVIKKIGNEIEIGTIVRQLSVGGFPYANANFVKLFKFFLSFYPNMIDFLCGGKDQKFLSNITTFIEGCRKLESIPAWDLLTSVLSSMKDSGHTTLSPNIVLNLLDHVSEVDQAVEVLNCMSVLLCMDETIPMIYQYECKANASKSIIEFLKKFMLSENEEEQLLSIRCFSTLVSSKNVSFGNMCHQRGIVEYLLELLPSSSPQLHSNVTLECLIILQQLAQSEIFYTSGHMVYGFKEIVSCLLIATNHEVLYQGFTLLDVMLKHFAVSNKQTVIVQDKVNLMKLLKKSFDGGDATIKHETVSCFISLLQCYDENQLGNFEFLYELMYTVFIYIEAKNELLMEQTAKKAQFVYNSHHALLLLNEQLKKCNSSTTSITNSTASEVVTKETLEDVLNISYHLFDRYVIPLATQKLLMRKDFAYEELFYKLVLSYIKLEPTRGSLLSLKFSQSSFIAMAYRFKVMCFHSANYTVNETLTGVLLHLCMAVDSKHVRHFYEDDVILLRSLTNFATPLHSWKTLLENNKMNSNNKGTDDDNYKSAIMLMLIGCSHMAGCCLFPFETLSTHIADFLTHKKIISQLPVLSRRHLLYIWCQIDQNASKLPTTIHIPIIEDSLIALLSDEQTDITSLFHVSDNFLIWLLSSSSTNSLSHFTEKYLRFYFSNDKKFYSDPDIEMENLGAQTEVTDTTNEEPEKKKRTRNYESLKSLLHTQQLFLPFIQKCVDVIMKSSEDCVLESIFDCISYMIPFIPAQHHSSLKQHINRHFLLTGNQEFPEKMAFLIKLLNNMLVTCDNLLTEEDFKLLFRLTNVINGNHATAMQLEVLNFFYVVFTKARSNLNDKVFSIFTDKTKILQWFQKMVFSNNDIMQISRNHLLIERLVCLITMISSELVTCSKMFQEFVLPEINVNKTLILECVACSQLPILQLGMLTFWRSMIQVEFQSPVIAFISESKSPCEVTCTDVRLLMIAVLGSLQSRNFVLRETAASCLSSLLEFLHCNGRRDLLQNNIWLNILHSRIRQKMSQTLEASDLILFPTFMKITFEKKNEAIEHVVKIIESIAASIASSTPPNQQTITNQKLCLVVQKSVQTVVDLFVKDMEYVTLRRLKGGLKSIRNETLQHQPNFTPFVNVNGIFLHHTSYNTLTEWLNTTDDTIKRIENRMNEIDNDQTDSGEEI